jgi:nitroreductase
MMNFKDLARKRYSVRNYLSTPVEKEKIIEVVEAALLAPSAVNFQPWKFVVVTEPALLTQLQGCYHRDWFKSAPACIVAIGDHDKGWHRPTDGKDYTDIDVAIAIDHLMLAATELDLGTCWICHFNVDACASLFNLPENFEPIALIPIGYPSVVNGPEKKRRAIEESLCWNRFEE